MNATHQHDYVYDIPQLMPPNEHGALLILIYDSLDARDEWIGLVEEGVRDFHGAACLKYDLATQGMPGSAYAISQFLAASRNAVDSAFFVSVLGLAEAPDDQFAQFATSLNIERESLRVEKCWLALWMTPGRMDELDKLAPDFLSCAILFRPSFDRATLRDEVVNRAVKELENKHGVSSEQFLNDWEHNRAEDKYPADWKTWLSYLQARRDRIES